MTAPANRRTNSGPAPDPTQAGVGRGLSRGKSANGAQQNGEQRHADEPTDAIDTPGRCVARRAVLQLECGGRTHHAPTRVK